MAPIHEGPPPGFMTARQAAESLSITPPTFYKYYADLLDSWQIGKSRGAPRLYRESDLDLMRAWINLKKGLEALGMKQASDVANWRDYVEAGEYDNVCPVCDSDSAVTNYPAMDRVWCPACGKIYEVTD
jgi:hypothetical protein